MYNEFFGFKEAPFSIAPDPRYLYMTPQHREALAHLVYGLNSEGGCILLTGEVGTGKTTVCRCLLEQIPERANVALVLNPKVSATELLETICDELKIEYPEEGNTVKTYIDRINRFLIEANARNEKTVLIIDEAQNLDSTVLEQLRLLTNLETNQRKLLQIIILGQPELLDILARPEMRQLAQRITARFHLNALAPEEIKAYITHRLAVAGQNVQLFPEPTLRRLFRLSSGIPRLINILCDRALLGSYVQNQHIVDTHTLNTAAKEVFGELKNVETRRQRRHWPLIAAAVIAAVCVTAFAFWIFTTDSLRSTTLPRGDAITPNIDTAPADSSAPIETTANTQSSEAVLALPEHEAGLPTDAVSQPDAPDTSTITQAESVNKQTTADTTDALRDFIADAPASSKVQAYTALFRLWNLEYDESRYPSACAFATKQGLECLHRQGNLNSLKRINRPAVMHVYNDDGRGAFITLRQINNGQAVFETGDKTFSVSSDTLEAHWYGEYSLMWQTPPFYSRPIQSGEKGPVVQWLDQQLARVLPENTRMIHDVYNTELTTQVTRFQQSVGLPADGIAGPMTLIHLNTVTGASVPLLLPPATVDN